jgi:glycosyltransferase involved in cell wall biosynthesis
LQFNLTYDISVLGAGTRDKLSRTGVFRVVENLLLGLCESDEVNLRLSADPEFLDAARTYLSSAVAVRPLSLTSTAKLGQELSVRGDIFHSPFYAIPEAISVNTGVVKFLTVHDLIPLKLPQFFTREAVAQFKGIMDSITRDTRIFCTSHSTRNDLCNYLDIVDPENVQVTHLAASPLFRPVTDPELIASAKRKFGIPDAPYVLSLCTLEPRKNIDTAIDAFLKLVEEQKVSDLNLVLVGSKGWKIEALLERYLDNPSLEKRLFLTGFVRDEDLAPLYSGALAFVYPSHYEGFGLPPLEAMQCGVPVITSNNSSLPEVVGDAGILVDSRDRDALAQSILDLVTSEPLRSSLRAKSLQQAAQFSWEKLTEETISGYRRSQVDVPDPAAGSKSRKLRVGINFTGLIPGKIGGHEKYMRALVQYIPHISKSHELFVFLRPETMDEIVESEGVQRVCIKRVPQPDAKTSEIHRAVEKLGIDIWFSPLLVLDPLTLDIPSVYCVPDLQHEYYPEFFSEDVLGWREKYFRRSAEIADGIITVSNYSKRSILHNYKVAEDKVHVTLEDCPTYFTLENAIENEDFVRKNYGLPERFILYPANLWAHKNHLTLIKALECYEELYGNPPTLMLTGYQSEAHQRVLQLIKASTVSDRIRFLGYVPNALMPAIYRNAMCLVFPSMFEGFGIPLVEAMRSGCPIIAANNTSIPEIAGDAALYFNTMDPVELAVLIRFVTINSDLRNFLRCNGSQRAKRFSFERCARETLHVFDEVYERSTTRNESIVGG